MLEEYIKCAKDPVYFCTKYVKVKTLEVDYLLILNFLKYLSRKGIHLENYPFLQTAKEK